MIGSILKLLEHWLCIQATRAQWELERDIEHYVQRCESDIRRLRANGDDATADRVRHQLLRSSGIILPRQPNSQAATGADASSKNC